MSFRVICRTAWATAVSVGVAGANLAVGARIGAAEPCAPVAIGIDSSEGRSSVGAFLGEAPGQTFMARDTLIRSLTVWRVALQDTNLFGMHLYITETDSAGMPLTDRVVLDGPTARVPYGDGVHHIPFQWDFDPPVVLPRAGRYAFFLRMEPCVLGYFDVLSTGGRDLYLDGSYWRTTRSFGCILLPRPSQNALADMIFRMEFCSTAVVPVRRRTWGEIKVIYR